MSVRRLLTPVAALALSATFIVAPVGPGLATKAPVPVAPHTTQVALTAQPVSTSGPASSVARGRALAAVAGRTRAVQLSPAQSVPNDVAVVGLTWRKGSGANATAEYRVRTDRGWGSWQPVHMDTSRDGDRAGTVGSDPIVLTGARAVQARIQGTSAAMPTQPQLSVIDPGSSEADSAVGSAQPGSAAAASQPRVYSRAEWGADETLVREAPTYAEVYGAIVHHTDGTNNYTPDQVPRILRGIYAFHVKGRGWNDIGYNFLVDKWGRTWEGRAGGVNRAVSGAHTLGFNGVTMGVSMLGNYDQVKPTSASLRAVARVIGWKASIHGFPTMGSVWLFGKKYPRVMGHRDPNQTDCPGRYLYAALPTIRRLANTYSR